MAHNYNETVGIRLSREPVDEPLERFMAAAGDEGWRVVGREIGATSELP